MDKKDKINKAMNQAYRVDEKPISGNKGIIKRILLRNWIVIVNLILKIIEVGTLIAIWYELFLNNNIIFD